jgi:hypothetical protein
LQRFAAIQARPTNPLVTFAVADKQDFTGTGYLLMPQDAAFCAVPADEDLTTACGGSFVRAEFNRKEAISPVERCDH